MNILDYLIFVLLVIVTVFWLYFISKDRKLGFRRLYKSIKYHKHINKNLLFLFVGNPAFVILSTFFYLDLWAFCCSCRRLLLITA